MLHHAFRDVRRELPQPCNVMHAPLARRTWFENACRIPLIVSAPGKFKAGRITTNASHLDLLPTLAEIANDGGAFQPAAEIDGKSLLGALSAYLAAFNLLPIPALDGGRLMFLGYEAATRKRANPTVEAHIHVIGLVMMLGLMLYVTFANDVPRFWK